MNMSMVKFNNRVEMINLHIKCMLDDMEIIEARTRTLSYRVESIDILKTEICLDVQKKNDMIKQLQSEIKQLKRG